jgi:hypothetical protein
MMDQSQVLLHNYAARTDLMHSHFGTLYYCHRLPARVIDLSGEIDPC